ncbi:MAG TPA: DUF3108 domain-containing protein [Gammaproteobacteria bacterium]|nr:DUF3108 domain-containing protein [Gammaproteobacteria bacterium]
MRRLISLLLWLLTATVALAADPQQPGNFVAHYTMYKGNMILGDVRRSLSAANDGKFLFESAMHSTGLVAVFVKDQVNERSLWTYQNNKIKPVQYSYDKTGGRKERHVNLVFDWKKGIAKNTAPGADDEIPIEPGTYDQLVYQLALMYDLQQGKTELTYPMVDTHKFKTYQFRIAGEETLETPLGALKTVKVERVPQADGKKTILWCASSLKYLPVRIEEAQKDGDQFSILIRSVEGL